jgi:putative N-acetylmannosamine-6-phosphate epimerase
MYLFGIFKLILRVNKNIIQISSTEYIQIVEQNIIHITLVGYRAISQSKRHNFTLIGSVSYLKSNILFRGRIHTDTVKCLTDIELSEDFSLR